MRISAALIVQLVAVSFTFLAQGADALTSVADKYSDGKLTVEWVRSDTDYRGTITSGTQQFPATAQTGGEGIKGSFVSGAHQFPFTASINADTLTLVTGGTTYVLKNQSSAANPLAPANPLATGATGAWDAPAGCIVVTTTDMGKALSMQKDGVASVQAALEATFPDLDRYFGTRPVIGSAYQDAKDPKSGGATFSTTFNGQPVKGIISCKLNDKGAAVAVIYARADSSKAQWEALEAPPTSSAAAPAQVNAAVAAQPAFPLHEFDFADGTGSLELADGWATKSQTCINPVLILGPAQQNIVLNNSVMVETPDSPMQRVKKQNQQMMAQMAANARAAGRPAPPPMPQGPPSLVSPYLEPVDALKALMPQFSKMSEFNHGPSSALDRIISAKDAPCFNPKGKGAIISYAYTQTTNGQPEHFRRAIYLQTYPMNAGMWVWLVTGVAAPDATFDQDRALMFAMQNSLKINQPRWTQALNAQSQQNMQMITQMGQQESQALAANAKQFQDDQDTRNSIYQQQHDAQMDGYAQHNQQWAADETQKQRNAADFIETIKGTRTIYDTQTGAVGSADLNYATGVVDSLNQAALDPNRFVQIPLRDELYAPTPVPGR
jgi:hypothetical protein